nr:MAG TPA: hypothetical protein [Caudoviricetes sp.]
MNHLTVPCSIIKNLLVHKHLIMCNIARVR